MTIKYNDVECSSVIIKINFYKKIGSKENIRAFNLPKGEKYGKEEKSSKKEDSSKKEEKKIVQQLG